MNSIWTLGIGVCLLLLEGQVLISQQRQKRLETRLHTLTTYQTSWRFWIREKVYFDGLKEVCRLKKAHSGRYYCLRDEAGTEEWVTELALLKAHTAYMAKLEAEHGED